MGLTYPQVSHSITGNTAGATAIISSGTYTLAGGNNITLSQAGNAVTISGANALSASGFASSTGTMILSAGAGLALSTGASTITISTTGSQVNSIGPTGSLSSGNITISGVNLTVSSNGASVIQLSVGAAGGGQSFSATQNFPQNLIAGSVASKSGTVTGTAGFGSSLFLNRINLVGTMNLSEVQLAMDIDFPATNQGAGTMSQSFVLYSFGNSTSLASVMSASSAHTWGTGTITAGASTSLTQFQGGWSVPKIHQFTFASTSVGPGDYVIGNLVNFAQGSSTWTIQLYGAPVFMTNSTSFTNVSTTAQTTMTVMSSAASLAITNKEGTVAHASASGATITTNSSHAIAAVARTVLTGTATTATGLSAIALSTQQIIPQYLTTPNFVYIGTNSTTSGLANVFLAGIMSTGAVPVAITVTSTAVTYSGSAAGAAPWFCLAGA